MLIMPVDGRLDWIIHRNGEISGIPCIHNVRCVGLCCFADDSRAECNTALYIVIIDARVDQLHSLAGCLHVLKLDATI